MDTAVAAHGQGLLHGFLDAVGADGENRQFSADLLLQPDRLFNRVFVVFVHAKDQIAVIVPAAVCGNLEFGFHVRNLLYAYQNLHFFILQFLKLYYLVKAEPITRRCTSLVPS